MTKTRLEKIADLDEQIANIRKRQQKERQKYNKAERTARTRRLCSRHGLLEKMMPEIIPITDEQFQAFLEKAVANNYGRDILNKIIAQHPAAAAPQAARIAARADTPPATKPAETEQENGEGEDEGEGNGARVNG